MMCIGRMNAVRMALCAALLAMPGLASAELSQAAKLNAYSYALRCFIANTVSAGDKRYNPGGMNDAALKQGAYRAYNAAKVMGGQLGYAKERIAEDIAKSGNVEGALMLRNDGYFQRARADCIKLGML